MKEKSTEARTNDLAKEKLATAKREISEAETDLDTAMRAIQSQERAEKRTITTALERAFQRLQRARKDLAELETIIE